MFATAQSINHPEADQSNPFTAVKTVNRSALSKGAKVLYSQLRLSAGKRGHVRYRLGKLSQDTNSSISSTKDYVNELRAVGLVISEARPGYSNLWYVFDPPPSWDGQPVHRPGGSQSTDGGVVGASATILKNVEKIEEKERSTPTPQGDAPPTEEPNETLNVICLGSEQPNPEQCKSDHGHEDFHETQADQPERVRVPETTAKIFDSVLLKEVLTLTGDRKSQNCWISVVRQVSEEEIRIGLSALRQAMNETVIEKPGAYLLSVIRHRNPDLSFRRALNRACPQAHSRPDEPAPRTCAPPEIRRETTEDDERMIRRNFALLRDRFAGKISQQELERLSAMSLENLPEWPWTAL